MSRLWDEPYRWSELATYNAERARGLLHTPEWQARMAAQQATFNIEQRAKLEAEATEKGYVIIEVEGGTLVGPPDIARRWAEQNATDQ